VKEEIRKTEKYDWSRLKDKGISDRHLKLITKKIVLAKVMAEIFVQCGNGDFLPAFKKYYIAMMESMSQKGADFSYSSANIPLIRSISPSVYED
ncbi:MAG: hypothetical protein U9R60_05620, partial [Bacteroidota bacterium]|nr:hypothetical protein [Bacteroidota bacterium]